MSKAIQRVKLPQNISMHTASVHSRFVKKRAFSRLEQGDHGFDMNLERNNGNLVELCVECHDLTDSSAFRRWRINQEGKTRTHWC